MTHISLSSCKSVLHGRVEIDTLLTPTKTMLHHAQEFHFSFRDLILQHVKARVRRAWWRPFRTAQGKE